MTTFPAEIIEEFKRYGFKVYMRNPSDSYCIYADGDRIAYAQSERFGGISITTIHKPRHGIGSGFRLNGEPITAMNRAIAESGFAVAPRWATFSQASDVVKYKGIDAYRAKSKFDAAYTEV